MIWVKFEYAQTQNFILLAEMDKTSYGWTLQACRWNGSSAHAHM